MEFIPSHLNVWHVTLEHQGLSFALAYREGLRMQGVLHPINRHIYTHTPHLVGPSCAPCLIPFPLSTVTTCRDPGDVDHSRRVVSSNTFPVGSTVQFICDKGYALAGSGVITCQDRQHGGPKWSDRLPKCTRELTCRISRTSSQELGSNPPSLEAVPLENSCWGVENIRGKPIPFRPCFRVFLEVSDWLGCGTGH